MKQEQFLDVASPEEAHARWHAVLDLAPGPGEEVGLAEALGRVLAEDVRAPHDVPGFDRSNVDGWAVRAEDTYGATERAPIRLRPTGETIDAGAVPEREIGPGETSVLATGGVVPRGADAVVMVEDTWMDDDGTVVVVRPTVPGGRLSVAGSDMTAGEVVLREGTRLSARETGTLAALGLDRVLCARRPRVAVLSTGNEVVPPGSPAGAGRVHDANATLLADAVREIGAEAISLGIVPDDAEALRGVLRPALDAYDAVLLSGGTSKGGGDVSYRVVDEEAEIVVHGVALKPGKPLCLAAHAGKPVVVLPGFPTSAIFTFHAFVAPVLRRKLGRPPDAATTLRARVPRGMASEVGRAEFTLVNLVRGRSGWLAWPMGSGSGSVTTFARADGFFEVPSHVERVDDDEHVDVVLLSPSVEPADLVIVGSHCTGLDGLVSRLVERGLRVKVMSVGSGGGLVAARESACDLAPIHLYDPEAEAYNVPFVGKGMRLLEGYGRQQGLAYRTELEERLGRDGALTGAQDTLRAAAAEGLRIANRNPSSGTYLLVERLLVGDGPRPPGWHTAYRTHGAVAASVRTGRADWGVCLAQAAHAAGLCWRPLAAERYDFLVPEERWDSPALETFRGLLADPEVRAGLRAEGFDA